MYKYNFIKETSLHCTDLCSKQIFENPMLYREAPCRLPVNRTHEREETSLKFASVTRHLFKVV
jgi:hypothetical protein